MRTTSVVAVFLLLTICAACGGEMDSKALFDLLSRSEFNFELVADDARAFAGAGRIEYSPDAPSNATFTLSLDANVELDTKVLRNGSEMPIVIRTVLPGDTLILDMYLTGGAASGKFEVEFANPQGDHLATFRFSATGAEPDPVPDASFFVYDSPIPEIESVDAFTGVPGMGGGGTVFHVTGPGGTKFLNLTNQLITDELYDDSFVWGTARLSLMTDNLTAPADQRYKFYTYGNFGYTSTSFNNGRFGLSLLFLDTTTSIERGDGSHAGAPPPQTYTIGSPKFNLLFLHTPTETISVLAPFNVPAGQKAISASYDKITNYIYFSTEEPANDRTSWLYALDLNTNMGPNLPPGIMTGKGTTRIVHKNGIVVTANELTETVGVYMVDSSATEGLTFKTNIPAGGPVRFVDARAHDDIVEATWAANGELRFARIDKLDGSVLDVSIGAVLGMPQLVIMRWFDEAGALFASQTKYGLAGNAQMAFNLPAAYGK